MYRVIVLLSDFRRIGTLLYCVRRACTGRTAPRTCMSLLYKVFMCCQACEVKGFSSRPWSPSVSPMLHYPFRKGPVSRGPTVIHSSCGKPSSTSRAETRCQFAEDRCLLRGYKKVVAESSFTRLVAVGGSSRVSPDRLVMVMHLSRNTFHLLALWFQDYVLLPLRSLCGRDVHFLAVRHKMYQRDHGEVCDTNCEMLLCWPHDVRRCQGGCRRPPGLVRRRFPFPDFSFHPPASKAVLPIQGVVQSVGGNLSLGSPLLAC